MEKNKSFISKHKTWVGIVVALIVVAIVATIVVKKRKIDLSDQVQVEFSGYNTKGTAALTNKSDKKFADTVFEKLAQKQGMKKATIQEIRDHDYDTSYLSPSSKTTSQLKKMQKDYNQIDLRVQPSKNLSNGDKVKVKFDVKDNNLLFKSFSKTFTVKGLKKAKQMTANQLINKHLKVKFSGFNQRGAITVYGDDDFAGEELKVKNNGQLANGDQVNISLSKSMIKDTLPQGYTLKGSRAFTVNVKNLPDPKKLTNVDQVIAQFNDQIKEQYPAQDSLGSNDTKLKSVWLLDHAATIGDFSRSQASATSIKIFDQDETDDSPDFSISEAPGKLSVLAIYEVTKKHDSGDDNIKEVAIGYGSIEIKDNKLAISDEDEDDLDTETVGGNDDVSYQTIVQKLAKIGTQLQ